MCREAGVYLPPYFLDLNTIEEFFIKLKAFITKQWHEYKSISHQDFRAYLECCVNMLGERESSAEGHFQYAGVTVETAL
jgi:hypothetical protein